MLMTVFLFVVDWPFDCEEFNECLIGVGMISGKQESVGKSK
jgi:hypothetical protein